MSTPVTPLQMFNGSTQRALEEFRLNYNTSLASMPKLWAESLGDVLPGDSLKDTYPIALDVVKYHETMAQNAAAWDTKAKEVSVIKREFRVAAEADAKRIKRGDHAVAQAWMRKSEAFARARQFLRNELVATLLEGDALSGNHCFDGVDFFDQSHPVNQFDVSITFAGSATWSNLQTAATPLNAEHLTEEKALFKRTPGPDGRELGLEATHILVPTCLDDACYNLLSIQDLILSGTLDGAGGGQMGTIKNPHFNQGMTKIRAPELTGTTAGANWYLLSATAFQMGLFPWVIAEDTSEEIRNWDESSDYYKSTGRIKIESIVALEAALLFPHGIRKITGA